MWFLNFLVRRKKKMNKTRKIKEIIGTVLEKKDFKYLRCERGIVWTFEKKEGKRI